MYNTHNKVSFFTRTGKQIPGIIKNTTTKKDCPNLGQPLCYT